MMRDLTLAIPLNNALARDVAIILQGEETAARIVINGAKRMALPLGIIAMIALALALALFALGKNYDIWRERVLPTRSGSTEPILRTVTHQNVVTERPPALTLTVEAPTTPAAREDVGIVPGSGKHLSDPVPQRVMRPSPRRIMALSTRKGAATDRRAAPIMAKAVQAPAQDQQQVAGLTAPIASAAPMASREREQSVDDEDHVTAAIHETAAAALVTTRVDARRRAAIDAIRDLRRQ